MIGWKKRVSQGILWAIAACAVLVMLGVTLVNPSLTRTELWLRYWWVYAPGLVIAVLAGVVAAKLGDK